MDIKTYNTATELLDQIKFLKDLMVKLSGSGISISIGPIDFSESQGGRIKWKNGESFFFTGFGEFEQNTIGGFKILVSDKIKELETQFKNL